MYSEPIDFERGLPIAVRAYETKCRPLHCHDGTIEVLMILQGDATVIVGFETFHMTRGEYVVIRALDVHSIFSEGVEVKVLSLFFEIEHYKKTISYLNYVFFACESFDLARYKNEEQFIRNQIISIVNDLENGSLPSVESALEKADELLLKLVSDYDLRNYYNRKWNADLKKNEKYYKIAGYMQEKYFDKNLLDYIAKKEFYSKSYIAHLFKEVGASSFQDVLNYIRIFFSIKGLLTTSMPIHQIADDVGFSDIKYYILYK